MVGRGIEETNFDKRKTVTLFEKIVMAKTTVVGFRPLMNALSEIIVKQNL